MIGSRYGITILDFFTKTFEIFKSKCFTENFADYSTEISLTR